METEFSVLSGKQSKWNEILNSKPCNGNNSANFHRKLWKIPDVKTETVESHDRLISEVT